MTVADSGPRLLTRSSQWFAVAQAAVLAAGFLLQLSVGRTLSSEDYARFVVVHSVGLVLVTLLMSVVPNAARQIVSVDRSSLSCARWMIWRVQFPLTIVAATALGALSGIVANWFDDSRLAAAFCWLAIDLALKAGVLEPHWHLLNGLGRHHLQATLVAAHGVFRLLFVVGALWLESDLSFALMGLVVASLLSSLVVLICLLSESQGSSEVMVSPSAIRALLMPWFQFSLLVDVVTQSLAFVSLWVLKATAGEAHLGSFAACQMLVQPLLPLGLVLSRAAFAPFARAIAESRRSDAAQILHHCFCWAMVMVGLIFVVTQHGGTFLVSLIYGSRLASQAGHLGTLALGMSGIALTGFFCDMLAAGHWLKTRFRVTTALLVMSVPVAVILVRSRGPSGAALALLLIGFLGTTVSATALTRRVGEFVAWKTLLHVVIATLLGCGIAHWVSSREAIVSELAKVVFVVAGYLVTIAIFSTLFRYSHPATWEHRT